VPYLSAIEVCSRQGAIQIHVYLYLYLYLITNSKLHVGFRPVSKSVTLNDIELRNDRRSLR